jgi:putative Ca2+/H+ antiporter (TMEM165/GDT1 family)
MSQLLVLLLAAAASASAREALPSGGASSGVGGASNAAPGISTSGSGFVPGFFNGAFMTFATEIGDKTFCIAAIMAMRYNRALVFSGAASALFVMTVLSVGIGVALPTLLPRVYTHYAAAALFAYFGVKLLLEARAMPATSEQGHGELADAEAELREAGHLPTPVAGDAEAPSASPSEAEDDPDSKTQAGKRAAAGGSSAEAATIARDWPILTQAFTITFLAEWGDRSQIATIAMAAAQDPWGVALGAVIAHWCCTAIAVIGGRLLAARISERTVAFAGGVLFLIFAIHSLLAGPEASYH